MAILSPTIFSSVFAAISIGATLVHRTHSFVMPQTTTILNAADASLPIAATSISPFSIGRAMQTARRPQLSTSTVLFMSTPNALSTLSITLEKPLGLILEETEDGTGGVKVTQVNEGGSAFESPYAEQLIQLKISTVMGQDVSSLSFDDVMDVIINAPSPLDVEFVSSSAAAAAESETTDEVEAATPSYAMGTLVKITVQQPETNKPDIILEAKVGDNLRTTLLSNKDIELYRGMKKKFGNCGGGAQCGFCAVELIDEEGVWGERIEYEAKKIGKNGSDKCRLACVNNIVGPATVRTL